MIRAVILALGLLTGTVDIDVQFAPGADTVPHSVVVYLDGAPAAQIGTAPWKTWIELGDELTPRELVVVSRDAHGREIDRVTRWLNLYEPPEAATNLKTPVMVLLDDASYGGGRGPSGLESWIEIDGEPAEVLEITYPEAELWIVRDPKVQNDIKRAASIAFAAELGLEDAVGFFEGDALSRGPDAARQALASEARFARIDDHRLSRAWEDWRTLLPLEDGTDLHFVSPWGAPVSQIEVPRQIFSTSQPMDAHSSGVPFNLFNARPLGRWFRLADAVAMAGLQSTARARRRAVVLMVDDSNAAGHDAADRTTGTPDQSLYDATTVRRYLAELGIPLRVWTFGNPKDAKSGGGQASVWGPARSASPADDADGQQAQGPGFGLLGDLSAAHAELAQTLQRQRIVWIRGRHLPGRITLSPEARGVRLVRDTESERAPARAQAGVRR